MTAIPTYNPTIITFDGGTNDALGIGGTDPTYIMTQWGLAIDAVCAAAPAAQLCVFSILAMSNVTGKAVAENANALLPALIATKKAAGLRVHLFDMSAMLEADLVDGIHPSDPGYLKEGSILANKLISLL